MDQQYDELLAEITSRQSEWIRFLQSLIQAPSPNPPGDTRAAATVVQQFLSAQGIKSDLIAPQPHAPNVVTSFDCATVQGPRVIYNGHIDTFPASNPSEWTHGLYSGFMDEGRIHGLGSVDMKAGTAASVIAFTLLYKRRHLLRGSVGLTAVSDEETGGRWGSKYLLDKREEESAGKQMRNWKGDVVINGEPGGLQSIRFGEKGTLRLTFTIRTKGANGAYRHISRGANIIAAKLIVRLLEIEEMKPNLPDNIVQRLTDPEVQKVADEIMGDGASNIILVPTVNIGVIKGGAKVNTIPEQCEFEADIRLPIGMLADGVMLLVNKILDDFPEASVAKQEAACNPANYCSLDHPLVSYMQNEATRATKRKPVLLAGIGGTDCKFWRYLNVPAYVYGPSPKGMGATNEAAHVEEFITTIKVHALSVFQYLTREKGTDDGADKT
jgi:succinyl-diaminopimelate desuccinylase